MRRIPLLLIMMPCLVTWALPVWGSKNEVILGATTAASYNSNVRQVENDVEASWGYELGPKIRLRRSDARYSVNINYQPTYTWQSSDVIENEWRQLVTASADWQISPVTKISVRDLFRYELNNQTEFDTTGQDFFPELRQFAEIRLDHTFDPRFAITAIVWNRYHSTESDLLADFLTTAFESDIYYSHTQRLRFGGGIDANYQSVQPGPATQGLPSYTGRYSLTANMQYQITPEIGFRLRAGPTYVITRVSGGIVGALNPAPPPQLIPIDIPSQNDTDIDYVADVSVWGSWQNLESTVSYARTNTSDSRFASTLTLDQVVWNTRWDPDENWAGALRFSWSGRQNQTKEALTSRNRLKELDQFMVATTVSRRLARETTVHLTFDYTYRHQISEFLGLGGNVEETDERSNRFRVYLRFDFNLAPFRF